MKKGLFIVFEGLDLTGKSTIIKELKNKYPEFIYTREPGGTDCELAEEIRNFILNYPKEMNPVTEAYLFAASRAVHVQKIQEWLKEGKTVICDRFIYSSMYYQGIMKDLGVDNISKINSIALNGLEPDFVFFVTVAEAERLSRMNSRGEINELDRQSANINYIEANAHYHNTIINAIDNKNVKTINTTSNNIKDYITEIEQTIKQLKDR